MTEEQEMRRQRLTIEDVNGRIVTISVGSLEECQKEYEKMKVEWKRNDEKHEAY